MAATAAPVLETIYYSNKFLGKHARAFSFSSAEVSIKCCYLSDQTGIFLQAEQRISEGRFTRLSTSEVS